MFMRNKFLFLIAFAESYQLYEPTIFDPSVQGFLASRPLQRARDYLRVLSWKSKNL